MPGWLPPPQEVTGSSKGPQSKAERDRADGSGSASADQDEPVALAAVAVPLPLPEPLTYSVPAALRPWVMPGVRVRVRVGKRKLVGVVMELPAEAPEGVRLRPLEEVVDDDPVLSPELLELARFTADYYFAPPGEVIRALLPSDLPGGGERRLRLTDAGALALPSSEVESQVVELLRESSSLSISELRQRLPVPELGAVIEELIRRKRVAASGSAGLGGRMKTAYDLAPGELEAHIEGAGRSPQGRAVIRTLADLARPATAAELTGAVGCTTAVLRRLVKKGILRSFTQMERISLSRHRLGGEGRPDFELRPDQAKAVTAVEEALAERRYAPFLLQGMTGSGKTEVYLRAVEATLAQDRSSILLVPEIALVPALAGAVRQRFGDQLALLHSSLGASERRQEWQRIRAGDARVVLGPRSAILAPVRDLGLVVVDEEQDSAYKQDVTPRYHGRDLALVRARHSNAAVLLVSATPSLETRLNAQRQRFGSLTLTARAGHGALPDPILVDLKQEDVPRKPGEVILSIDLRQEIEATVGEGSQVILLRNRRGYSPVLLCRACGEDFRCDDCGLARTYHRKEHQLVCHYCGSAVPAPSVCPSCESDALDPIGTGTERLEEQFREMFPGVSVDVLDRDAVRRPGGAAAVLERFRAGGTQVLIGTQMVAKGHHFPNVALAGVLSADTYLGFPDFRAVERTYNLLVQLAGRAGRGDRPGRVVLQTYHPQHYAIQAALHHDDEAFATEELRFRRMFHYPPYTRLVQLLSRDTDRRRAHQRLRDLADAIYRHPLSQRVRITGPAPAAFEKLRGKWRFQLLLRGPSHKDLHQLLRDVLPEAQDSGLVVDVDPQDLM
ncbi:MAG: primosomal protein N' [Acidobacteriota bacterium]